MICAYASLKTASKKCVLTGFLKVYLRYWRGLLAIKMKSLLCQVVTEFMNLHRFFLILNIFTELRASYNDLFNLLRSERDEREEENERQVDIFIYYCWKIRTNAWLLGFPDSARSFVLQRQVSGKVKRWEVEQLSDEKQFVLWLSAEEIAWQKITLRLRSIDQHVSAAQRNNPLPHHITETTLPVQQLSECYPVCQVFRMIALQGLLRQNCVRILGPFHLIYAYSPVDLITIFMSCSHHKT